MVKEVIFVDFGRLIDESFEYTKDGLFKNLGTWVILIILALLPAVPFAIIFVVMFTSLMAGAMPDFALLAGGLVFACILAVILGAFYQGYIVRIYRGETPLPAVSGFGKLFADGIKYFVIGVVYSIPVFIILLVVMAPLFLVVTSQEPSINSILALLGGAILGLIISLVVGFVLALFFFIGIIRFSRTGRIGEAFNFSAIRKTIGRIGWGSYILALIIVMVIVIIVEIVLAIIPFIGSILQLIVAPFISVFVARYICLVYDQAGEPQAAETPELQ